MANDRQQKDLFYDDNENNECPAGYGKKNTRLHYMVYKVSKTTQAHIQRKDAFMVVHNKLKTATVIIQALQHIIQSLKDKVEPKGLQGQFHSDFDTLLMQAWVEHYAISWEQVLNGRISKKWGLAQGEYYSDNPDTKD